LKFDFCVIGGGIVGVASARALLQRYPGADVVLVEKEDRLGLHQTGHNSGVIHSGIYYEPGSLKARLCAEGARRTKEYCTTYGIPFEERGKLIVATSPSEDQRLELLRDRAAMNGIPVQWLRAEEIREREPSVIGSNALFVPNAAIVSYGMVLRSMAKEVEGCGGTIRLGREVTGMREQADGVEVDLKGETIQAKQLIACAGLQSDRLARMAGLAPSHKIVPFRGEYYHLPASRSDLVHSMIYPVPDPALPFLGIHLTPTIDGLVSLGPNAVLGFAREVYRKGSVNLRDTLSFATFPGFWRTAARHLRSGLQEAANSAFKSRYLRACQKYCPTLTLDDLTPATAGIRAQAVHRDGKLLHDFLFLQSPRMLHVCNAPSPAATSAMPIADMIVDRMGATSDIARRQ
jgi:(S)-2-hydroxyglutarate dehydrogenase